MIADYNDWRHRLPYWTCESKVFNTKLSALIYASKSNQNIEFCFNDHYLDTINWTQEPPLSIDEYYRQRAQSLRDNYDYLLIMYSGGSDSSTIVKTFLRNKIHVDEIGIYGVWNHKIDKYHAPTNLEQTYAAKDFLTQIASHGTKVSHINLLDSVESSLGSQDWIYQSDPLFTAQQACRFQAIFQRKDLLDLVSKGKKVAVVLGHDKARVVSKDDGFYHGFLDVGGLGTWIYPQFFQDDYNGPCLETFYCNISVPEIMIKQSHMITDWYWKNFGDRCKDLLSMGGRDANYTSRANTIMYPTTWREHETYSLGKSTERNVFTWAWRSEWLHQDLQDTRYYQNWINGVKTAFSLVDKKFVLPGKKGFVGHWSKLRKIRGI